MIVNTAYPYMTSAAPAGPVVFDGNTVNYPYSTENASLENMGFRLGGGAASVQFEKVDLSNYTKLNVTIYVSSFATRYNFRIQIIGPDGSVSGDLSYQITKVGTHTFDKDIPPAFRAKKCSLRLYKGSESLQTLLIKNLTCK